MKLLENIEYEFKKIAPRTWELQVNVPFGLVNRPTQLTIEEYFKEKYPHANISCPGDNYTEEDIEDYVRIQWLFDIDIIIEFETVADEAEFMLRESK